VWLQLCSYRTGIYPDFSGLTRRALVTPDERQYQGAIAHHRDPFVLSKIVIFL